MKTAIRSVLLSFILFLTLNFPAYAQTNLKKNAPTPSPVPKAVLPQMSAGKDVTLNNPVNSDLFVLGSNVSLEAAVSGDVYIAGGQVNIKNTIDQNLVVAGGVVNISGTIKKNLIVAGGQVNLEPGAVVDGYLLGAANQASISGKVNGPAKLAGNNVSITNTGSIGGDLEIYAQNPVVDPAATVTGEKRISQVNPPQNHGLSSRAKNGVTAFFSATTFFYFIAQLLVLFVIVRIFGSRLFKAVTEAYQKPFSVMSRGFVGLVVLPIAVILLFVTIVGIPLAVLTGIIYGISLYAASLIGAVFVGRWFFDRKWIINSNLYLQAFVGFIILFAIGFIPVFGPIFKFLVFLLGLGLIFQWQRSWFTQFKAQK